MKWLLSFFGCGCGKIARKNGRKIPLTELQAVSIIQDRFVKCEDGVSRRLHSSNKNGVFFWCGYYCEHEKRMKPTATLFVSFESLCNCQVNGFDLSFDGVCDLIRVRAATTTKEFLENRTAQWVKSLEANWNDSPKEKLTAAMLR